MDPIFANVTNLCFVRRGDEVLLVMKKRGFGRGKWNAPGGKVRPGEDPEAAAIREVREETGLTPVGIKSRGVIEFIFDGQPLWNNRCHIYVARSFGGQIAESDEARPAWFPVKELPFDKMWDDDRHWVPLVISGKSVSLRFFFDSRGNLTGHEEIPRRLPRISFPLPRFSAKWMTAVAAGALFVGGSFFLRDFQAAGVPDTYRTAAEQAILVGSQTKGAVDAMTEELRIMGEQEAAENWGNAREHALRGIELSGRFADFRLALNGTLEILDERVGEVRPSALRKQSWNFTQTLKSLPDKISEVSRAYNLIFDAYRQEYSRREAGEEPAEVSVDVAGVRQATDSLNILVGSAESAWEGMKVLLQ